MGNVWGTNLITLGNWQSKYFLLIEGDLVHAVPTKGVQSGCSTKTL